jgi:hypothetical protein
MAQKMVDAGLDRRLGKDGDDGFRKALERIDDGDENVIYAPLPGQLAGRQPDQQYIVKARPYASVATAEVRPHSGKLM